MAKILFIFLFFLNLYCFINSVMEDGCPNIQLMNNLNIEKFSGIWYEIMRMPSVMQDNEECTFYKVTSNNNNSMMIQGHSNDLLSGAKKSWNALAIPVINSTIGLFELEGKYLDLEDLQFMIYETDYTNYAITLICMDQLDLDYSLGWLIGRSVDLNTKYVDRFLDVMDDLMFPINYIIPSIQRNCS